MSATDSARERFRSLLNELFIDNTLDETLSLWRYSVEHVPHIAGRHLAVFDEILADPPADLVTLMFEDGWISLVHRPDDNTLVPYSYDEHLAWLTDVVGRMRAEYEARPGSG